MTATIDAGNRAAFWRGLLAEFPLPESMARFKEQVLNLEDEAITAAGEEIMRSILFPLAELIGEAVAAGVESYRKSA